MKTEIRDSAYKVMGYLEDTADKTKVYTAGGSLVGWYVKSENKTYDNANRFIGYGNITVTLL
jgi:hypothetical protein